MPRRRPTRDPLVAILGGATAALAFVGFAVLADGLRTVTSGGPVSGSPTDVFDTLPWPGLHSGGGALAVGVALAAVLGAGSGAGAVGFRRPRWGLVILLAVDARLGGLWVAGRPAGPGYTALAAGTMASVFTYLVLLRAATSRTAGAHRRASGTTPGAGRPTIALSRREALAAGALVAVAAGVGGML